MQTRLNHKLPREGLTWCKVRRLLSLPFSPCRLETWFSVGRFEEISPERLIQEGIQGVLVDADGTLGSHHIQTFPASSLQHVRELQEKGLKVAIFTNACEDRFEQFLNVPVVTNVPAKPDPRGFEIAMINVLELEDPEKICMVGDNYVTDGGAIDAGMRFIHVSPCSGNEPFLHRFFRFMAFLCARFYKKI